MIEQGGSEILFSLGPLEISLSVVTTWGIMLFLCGLSWLATRRLALEPDNVQTTLEGVVSAIDAAVRSLLPSQADLVLPFIGTLWILIATANVLGIVPGLDSPTQDLSVTAALAISVFLSVHWFGIQSLGLRRYLLHYLRPNPLLLPFHVLSEITRTIALAVRLFGNMMSLETAALLVLLVAGFLAPIPLLGFHLIEALVQAYIFGMLALVYIAAGVQTQSNRKNQIGQVS